MHYSPSTGGFYLDGLHPSIPADAVKITREHHRVLLDGQASGRRIVVDADGNPSLAEVDPPTIANVATRKLAEINAASNQPLAGIRREYPQFEIDTWPDQEAEARAWIADNSAVTPTLSGIAAERGVTVAELVPKVIEKADLYRPTATAVIGKRQRLEDAIKAAEKAGDREALEAISW